jgi:hypothetical protein
MELAVRPHPHEFTMYADVWSNYYYIIFLLEMTIIKLNRIPN